MVKTGKAYLIKETDTKVTLGIMVSNCQRMQFIQASGPTRLEAGIHLKSKMVYVINDMMDEEDEIARLRDVQIMKRASEKKIKHPRIIL